MTTFNLADLFEGVVDAVGPRPALVCGDGDGIHTRLTYDELEARANRAAHMFAALGVGEGDAVGLGMFNGAEFIECLLGLFKLGALPVNVNYRYGAEELRYLFDDADLVAAVVERDGADAVETVRGDLPKLREVLVPGDEYEALLGEASADRPSNPRRRSDDLYLIYTGGTTGMPKGVMWRHEDIFMAALGGDGSPRFDIPPLTDPDRIGEWAETPTDLIRRMPLCPLMHGGAQWLTLQALLNGGTAVLDTSRHYDPETALDLLAGEAVNMVFVIGDAVTRPLLDALEANPRRWDLSQLLVLGSGGAILSASTKERLSELLSRTKIVDTFGASESGGQGRLITSAGGPPMLRTDDRSCVFDDDLKPVEPGSGTIGRLARCGYIPLGYHKDPDKTAATFPVIDGVRWSMPGDLAQVTDDGSILLLGRGAVCINTGGEKVFPEEVEQVVKSHPDVLDALVVGVPDERFGQRVAAVVAFRAGRESPGDDAMSAFCHDHISGYKVPREWHVVDEVERLPTGKPDYRWAASVAAPTTPE